MSLLSRCLFWTFLNHDKIDGFLIFYTNFKSNVYKFEINIMMTFLDESIFEDSVTIFKEEKMPGKGSECTSLSSLTIDEDLPGVSDN